MPKTIKIIEHDEGDAEITIKDNQENIAVRYEFGSLDDALEALPNIDEIG